jgi:hypothetical protein
MPQQSGIYQALLEKTERDRDYYKTSLETLLKSIDDWNGSMVKETADDFVAAIAAYIEAKLEK